MRGATRRGIKKIFIANRLIDIAVEINGVTTPMLGPAGAQRELAFLPEPLGKNSGQGLNAQHLPVLLGSGMGHALEAVIRHLEAAQGTNFCLAVVDKEADILQANGLKERYAAYSNILWVSGDSAAKALNELGKWQADNGDKPFMPALANPFYLRLDKAYYGALRTALSASAKADFWNRADYAKFAGPPRVLLLTSRYFLIGDVEAACKRMGLEHHLVQVPEGELAAASFIEQLLEAVVRFRPDFILSINHLGVDREGILQGLLARLRLPLASWFVDNPHLILYSYHNVISPWTTVFTWDADNLVSLRDMGFEHVAYLPLSTDHARFAPASAAGRHKYEQFGWQSDVSFVGNSMLHKVAGRLVASDPPPGLRAAYQRIAADFADSDEPSVGLFLKKHYPDLLPDFACLGNTERQLSFEALITWEATLRYRLECIKAIIPFAPLIVGDDGWLELLQSEQGRWRRHSELGYYVDLPHFYPFSKVNFNCTSKQMKGAVNQRVFDVPATGSFVITDWRYQIENLFEPGKEVICYHSPAEATDLVARYLAWPQERERIALAARRRILAEHLYEHRLESIIKTMRGIYA